MLKKKGEGEEGIAGGTLLAVISLVLLIERVSSRWSSSWKHLPSVQTSLNLLYKPTVDCFS